MAGYVLLYVLKGWSPHMLMYSHLRPGSRCGQEVKGSKAFTMDGLMVKPLLKPSNSLTISWWNHRQSILQSKSYFTQ